MTTIHTHQFPPCHNYDAKTDLAKLLDLAIKGEEIVITQDNKPVAKISPIRRALKRGSAKGKVNMSDDF